MTPGDEGFGKRIPALRFPRNRPLTKKEMAALRSISTRAAITTTSFTNHCEWGDLKANPSKLLEKYFDAFVYVANWGRMISTIGVRDDAAGVGRTGGETGVYPCTGG